MDKQNEAHQPRAVTRSHQRSKLVPRTPIWLFKRERERERERRNENDDGNISS